MDYICIESVTCTHTFEKKVAMHSLGAVTSPEKLHPTKNHSIFRKIYSYLLGTWLLVTLYQTQ